MCPEYADNMKMLDGTATLICHQTNKINNYPKEEKIDELCGQVRNLHKMLVKQSKQRRIRRNRRATNMTK